jgi:glycosyltransferase involved in cell wall biosynthesis
MEVLIVDNSSVDSTVRIAEEHSCRVIEAAPERSVQRNEGAREARGDLLLFVDADMELAPGLLNACVERAGPADALCIREATTGSGYWVRVRAFERSRYFKSNLFEAARCYRKKVFEELGGYDPTLTGLEDYDLHARLLDAGFVLGWVETPLFHHEGGIGILSYLAKRKYYMKTDRIYASKHPRRWREQCSVRNRFRCILKKPITPLDTPLLPGLMIMRSLEWFLRR